MVLSATSGPEIDWLVYSWTGQPKSSFCNVHLNVWLGPQYDVPHAWELLTSALIDPRPERMRYAVRAAFLVWVYAWGIASDVVAKGCAPKPEADAVTRGMTASVFACTLWVVAWELATVLVVFDL